MLLGHYLGLVHHAETNLARAFRDVASSHRDEPDVEHLCLRFAAECEEHAERLGSFAHRYQEQAGDEPDRLRSELFHGTRSGGLALLRDLHDLYLMATESDLCWTLVRQAAQGLRDRELLDAVQACDGRTAAQLRWLSTRLKQAAPQALVVAEG